MSHATPPPSDGPLVLYDGDCGFCQRSIQTLLRLDKPGRLRFAPRDAEPARRITDAAFPHGRPESLILQDDLGVHANSSAVLGIARHLPAPWSWASAFLLVPRPLRDAVYRLVARNRHRLPGNADACLVPTPEQRARFLA